MDLLHLDINQCPDEFYEPNAFKNTNKCDEQSSYVSCRRINLIILKLNNFIFLSSVRSHPRPRLRKRRLQMRVQAGLRVSVRGSNHVLRRPVGGGRIPEHCDGQGISLRSVPVPIGGGRCNQSNRRPYFHRLVRSLSRAQGESLIIDIVECNMPSPCNCLV